MRKFEYLSPVAQKMLRHIMAARLRPEDDVAIPSVIIALRKQGIGIGQTLAAIEECTAADWLVKHHSPAGTPDRVALSNVAMVAMALQATG